ncbi:MAG: type II secretion system F family protein [Planctomycetaceae bacterium]|nr:type II secretion system F family protein [Planctomycetaceae bacterium]
MPTFQFEAYDALGQPIRDVIDATNQDEAQATIRSMGYYVTKISVQKAKAAAKRGRGRKTFALGGAGGKKIVTFTRQLSILQDAGLPILRSLKILEAQARPGGLKNALIDVCEEIEGGSTLSEAMGKSPKVFDRLYVNMIKAGEAGGALEAILQRLAEFKERSQRLKNKVIGAMIYPAMVILVTFGILAAIILYIVPQFLKMFEEFGMKDLPFVTTLLVDVTNTCTRLWFMFPLIPFTVIMFIALVCRFKAGRMGWHLYILKLPLFGKLAEKANLARTTRTLGTLVASGVPILESLTITRETSGNAMYEKIFHRVSDAIREGESIARPLKRNSVPGFHPVACFFWMAMFSTPPLCVLFFNQVYRNELLMAAAGLGVLGAAVYFMFHKKPVIEDLVVNMVDVGEETGELDRMMYKVADYYDEEVTTLTDGLMKLIEPMLIVFLGAVVLFIVLALFMPLITMITELSSKAGG